MAAHRYWRITGLYVQGPLELTDAMLVLGTVVPSPAPTLSATFAPSSGTLSTLLSGTTTDVVSWDASIVRLPSFALVFDAGAGGVDTPGLRLGSADSAATFPKDLLIQHSDDGFTWSTYQRYSELSYPGNRTLTGFAPVPVGDANYASVQLLLKGDGSSGSSTFVDSSPTPKTLARTGNTAISTTQSKFGAGSIAFDGTGDYLTFTQSSILGTADLTIEAWVRLNSTSTDQEIFCIGNVAGLTQYDCVFECTVGGGLRGSLQNGSTGVQLDISTSTGVLTTGAWYHVAFSVYGTTGKLFVNGVQGATGTVSGTRVQGRSDCRIGYLSDFLDYAYARAFNGYIDELRITKGVGRYTADFTPPAQTFPVISELPSDNLLATTTLVPRPSTVAHTSDHIAGADLDDTVASPVRAACINGADIENGGTGRIYGTTKEKPNPSLPATPFSRRVLLVDERSQLIIRQTWSDAATGAFEFRDLALGRPYTTLSYDHLRNYRATIADNQLAEPQA